MVSIGSTSGRVASGSGGRWLERFVRLGYGARALLYAVVASTALSLALGRGGQTSGSRGAMQTLARQSHGTVLLWLVTLGLAGYALWRLIQAVTHDDEDGLAKQIWMRLFYGVRGVLYGALAWSAYKIVSGAGSSGGSGGKSLADQVLGWPGGRWILGAVGLIVIGYGIWQWYVAATRRWRDDMRMGAMSRRTETALDTAAVAGFLGRGVVMAIIGGYLVWGAATHDVDQSIGMETALDGLAGLAYGPFLLGAVALGLLGFALYSLAESKYRRIDT